MYTSDLIPLNGDTAVWITVFAFENNGFSLQAGSSHPAATMHLDRKGMNDLQEAIAKALAEEPAP